MGMDTILSSLFEWRVEHVVMTLLGYSETGRHFSRWTDLQITHDDGAYPACNARQRPIQNISKRRDHAHPPGPVTPGAAQGFDGYPC